MLLHVNGLKGEPDLHRVVLDSLNIDHLLCRKQKVELWCGLVKFKVSLSLEGELGVIRVLLSITDNGRKALGVQEGVYFALPGGILGGDKFFKGRSGGTGRFISHGDRNAMRKAKES